MKSIQSTENPFFKDLVKLSGTVRQRKKSNQTLLDGVHLLEAYLDAGLIPQHILLDTATKMNEGVSALLKRVSEVAITKLDDKLFAELSKLKSHTGILALIAIPQPRESIVDCSFVLLLEDIQDPGNLGSILRSAAAAGCDAVFLSPGCADAWSPKVLRAAMGGHFALDIYEQQDLLGVAEAFSGKLLATTLQTKYSLYDSDLSGKIAFMIGNEGAGLSAKLLKLATNTITIPMPGKVESLNAAASAAICLFETVRQRFAAV